jgi:nitroreductase
VQEILKVIRERQSSRFPFDTQKPLTKRELKQILEAARWAPTAHNMQNYFIIVVDDKKLLKTIANIKSPVSEAFVRENYRMLSFSDEELKRKKVGIDGRVFPPEMRSPNISLNEAAHEAFAAGQTRQIQESPLLMVILYDPSRRAPASEGDFLGHLSLGGMIENMSLMAQALGVDVHIVSEIAVPGQEKEVRKLLNIPNNLCIALGIRFGHSTIHPKYLRVRREIQDFTYHNSFKHPGLE